AAADALFKFGETPDLVVPTLVQCYREGDLSVRQQAVYSLMSVRSRARSAVPMLTNAIATTTNGQEHALLLNALREISPHEATNYGPAINPYPQYYGR